MILGITGGTGCGKTTLLNVLKERGAVVLDCDAIYLLKGWEHSRGANAEFAVAKALGMTFYYEGRSL